MPKRSGLGRIEGGDGGLTVQHEPGTAGEVRLGMTLLLGTVGEREAQLPIEGHGGRHVGDNDSQRIEMGVHEVDCVTAA
jgi:hypothetical protein